MQPNEIKVHSKSATLELRYDDGVYVLTAEYLRVFSPSAEVQGHSPGQAKLQVGKKHVTFRDVAATGNYAIKLVFSDGHDSGIYSYAYLRELAVEYDARWADYLARLDAAGASREPQFIAVGRT